MKSFRRSSTLAVVLTAAFLGSAGCGAETSDGQSVEDGAPTTSDPNSIASSPVETTAADEPVVGANDPALARRLEGDYVIRKRRAIIQDLPVLGDTPTVALSYGLATIRVIDGVAQLTERYCRSTTESSSSLRSVVPDALPRSVDALRSPLTVWQDGEIVRWRRPEAVVVMGAHLEHPREDVLPTTASDTRVFDQDRDGHPGVTVRVEGFISGSLFLVQRSIDHYDGKLDADGALSAFLRHDSTSRIIAASSPLLRREVPQRNDPNPSRSNVLLVRVSGTMDCDALLEALPRLFVE